MQVVCRLHHQHWAEIADLEQLGTLRFRLSFDFVLRKKGKHVLFAQDSPTYKTGLAAACDGSFIGPLDMVVKNIDCSRLSKETI